MHQHAPTTLACSSPVEEETSKLLSVPHLTFSHPYPPTKIMFLPDKETARPDLVATSGDYLRIWRIQEDGVTMEKLLNNVRGDWHTGSMANSLKNAPMVSPDWHRTSAGLCQ